MSVYQDRKTDKWISTFRYKDWQGNTIRKLKRGFSSPKDALQWEEDFLSRNAFSSNMLFVDFARLYLSNIEPTLTPKTFAVKKPIIENWIIPYFEGFTVDEITSPMICDWQDNLSMLKDSDTGQPLFTKSYLTTIYSQLTAIFSHAVDHYGFSSNPAKKTAVNLARKYQATKEPCSASEITEAISFYLRALRQLAETENCDEEALHNAVAEISKDLSITKQALMLSGLSMGSTNKNEDFEPLTKDGKPKRILCVELKMLFDNPSEAHRLTGVNSGNIYQALTGKIRTAGGYHWMYIDPELTKGVQF